MRKRELSAFVFVLCVAAAVAAAGRAGEPPHAPLNLDGDFTSAIVVDAHTGAVLVARDATARRQPASMIKMLTELIVLEKIERGEFAFTDSVAVSTRAETMGGSQVWLRQGERFTIEDLLRALTIHSANDAAAALAEHVGGSLEAFVDSMNVRARRLGMADTEVHTVNGLPPRRGKAPDLTTARDMALLARALLAHERSLEWASQPTAPFRGGAFTLRNPNRLLGHFPGLDGLKTGWTAPAGYCLTATAARNGARLVSVVMGCSSARARSRETARLLEAGFAMYTDVAVVAAGAPVAQMARVADGARARVPLAFGGPLTVSVPRESAQDVALRVEIAPGLRAPLAAGAPAGRAVALLDGRELGSVPVVTSAPVAKGNWLERILR